MDRKEFMSGVINLKISLGENALYDYLELNDTITAQYEKLSFCNFLHSYSEKAEGKDCYVIKKGLSYNKIMTVIYYLYRNNYYTGFDDHIGCYFARKTTKPVFETEEGY